MVPKISHVFFGKKLIKQEIRLCVDSPTQQLKVMEEDSCEYAYDVKDVSSLEFCFHESGPLDSLSIDAFATLRFTDEQSFMGTTVPANHPIVLVLGCAYKEFLGLQEVVIEYQRLFPQDIVKLLPFTKFPDCVKQVMPRVARSLSLVQKERQKGKEQGEKGQKTGAQKRGRDAMEGAEMGDTKEGVKCPPMKKRHDDVDVTLGDSEEEVDPTACYYLIDGQRRMITQSGLDSLSPGKYLNDEVFHMAFDNIRKQFPLIHIFDSLTLGRIFTAFDKGDYHTNNQMSYRDFDKMFGLIFKKNNKRIDYKETFLAKKMLIFPLNHLKHWVLMVVVNPLLADVNNLADAKAEGKGHRAAAYYIDSLKGTAKYPDSLMTFRLDLLWRCIFPFLRLSAIYYSFNYLTPKLMPCISDINVPSQANNFDCGPHAITNAQYMAESFDELMKGPSTIDPPAEKAAEMSEKVRGFRLATLDYLDECRISKGDDDSTF